MATKFSEGERSRHRKFSANKIVELALQCARIRAFGSHINEDGLIEILGRENEVTLLEEYQFQLKHQSKLLLIMMSDTAPEVGDPA